MSLKLRGPAAAVCMALVAALGASAEAAPPDSSSGADLGLTMQDRPDPVDVGAELTYEIVVKNAGRRTGTATTTVTDDLPSSVTYRSASTTKGTCSGTTTVNCSIGDLAKGASATVTIVVTPNTAGTASNTARASATNDATTGNNSATATTTVRQPATEPPESPPVLPDSDPVWVERCSTACGPAPRSEAPMAYDAATGNITLFGGRTNSGFVDDTWTWNGAVWTRHDVTPRLLGVGGPSRTTRRSTGSSSSTAGARHGCGTASRRSGST